MTEMLRKLDEDFCELLAKCLKLRLEPYWTEDADMIWVKVCVTVIRHNNGNSLGAWSSNEFSLLT